MLNPLRRFTPLTAVAAALVLASTASASDRRFTASYEVTTLPKGGIELENTAIWEHRGSATEGFDVWDFRHELEFGITDRLQLSLYLANWSYTDPERRGRYENSGVEIIYNFTNPTTDFLGSAIYLEVLAGRESLELEGKLLLQKNFGSITVVYNVALEAEWEGEKFGRFDERNGEFSQSLGVSYDVSKNFSVGAEVLHEIDIADWKDANDSIVFAGPNVSFRVGRVFATVAGLFQLTDVAGEPDIQTRVIVGIDF